MKTSTKQILLSLLISIVSVSAQLSKSIPNHPENDYTPDPDPDPKLDETDEINNLDLKRPNSPSDLIHVMTICLACSSAFLLFVFCVKSYSDYKIRNTPVVDLGPFEGLSEVPEADLTLPQRKAIMEILFVDGKDCMTYHKKEDGTSSLRCQRIDKECPPPPPAVDEDEEQNYVTASNNTIGPPPSLPVLSMDAMELKVEMRPSRRLKLPSLKRRQTFSLLPKNDEDEDHDDNDDNDDDDYDVEMNRDSTIDTETNRVATSVLVDEESGAETVSDYGAVNTDDDDDDDEEMKRDSTIDKTNKVETNVSAYEETETENIFDCDADDDGICPICIDAYDEDDIIIKSDYCQHYFHKECIMQWLEKSFCCPCCRIEMISADDTRKAISIINSNYGLEKKAPVQSEVHDITPPVSPMSSIGSAATPQSPLT